MRRLITCGFLLPAALVLCAADLERDFSGDWILVPGRSSTRALAADPESFLKVTQDEDAIRCASATGGIDVSWSYRLDGLDRRYKIGGELRTSTVKWEGAALLVNTIVSGEQSYTVMDRWRLSTDRATLTITRQVVTKDRLAEGSMVYERIGAPATMPAQTPAPAAEPRATPAAPALTPRPVPPPAAPGEATVAAGTRVLLELVNRLNVKKSKPGDSVYLRTAVPVAAAGRIVIPSGSTVYGTIIESKTHKGKGDLYIRFETLTLPDGGTRDLRARPVGDQEGKIDSASDHGRDTRKIATGAAVGASIGGIAGAAAGHAAAGLGAGGIAGAAVGLISVLAKRPEVILPPGTQVEMVIDRDLRF